MNPLSNFGSKVQQSRKLIFKGKTSSSIFKEAFFFFLKWKFSAGVENVSDDVTRFSVGLRARTHMPCCVVVLFRINVLFDSMQKKKNFNTVRAVFFPPQMIIMCF